MPNYKYNSVKKVRKKYRKVEIYFQPSQKIKLQSEAKRCNISLSEYIRRQLIKAEDLIFFIDEKNTQKLLSKAIAEINKIGNNLNQIAKHTNSNKKLNNSTLYNVDLFCDELINSIKSTIETPPQLTSFLENLVSENPKIIPKLELFITRLKLKYDSKNSFLEK